MRLYKGACPTLGTALFFVLKKFSATQKKGVRHKIKIIKAVD